ncbi:hypothetical protein GEMRC1_003146 [Eukaryota sp. GEM-RC1]
MSGSFCGIKVLELTNDSQLITYDSSFINFIDADVYLHDSTRLMFNSGSSFLETDTYSIYSAGFCLLSLNDFSVVSANSEEIIIVEQLIQYDSSNIVGSDHLLVESVSNSDSFWTFSGGQISEDISITVNSHFIAESLEFKILQDSSFILLNGTGLINVTSLLVTSSLRFSSWSFVNVIGESNVIHGDGIIQNFGSFSIESDKLFVFDIDFVNSGHVTSNSPLIQFNSTVQFIGGSSYFSNTTDVRINTFLSVDQYSFFAGSNVFVSPLVTFMSSGHCSISEVLNIEAGAKFISTSGTSIITKATVNNSQFVLINSSIDFDLLHLTYGLIELFNSESNGLSSTVDLQNSNISINYSNISVLELLSRNSSVTFNDFTTISNLSFTEMVYSSLEISTHSSCSITFALLTTSSELVAHNSSLIYFIDADVYLHDSTRLMFNSGSNVVISCLKLSLYDNSTVVFGNRYVFKIFGRFLSIKFE